MSGQQYGSAIGFVAGFFLPGGPGVWAAIGGMAGNAIDPQHIQGPTLGDLSVQVTAEGAPRAIVFGRPQPFSGIPFQWGDYVRITVEEQQGKGGGPVIESERVLLTYAIGICEGPATCIRAWRDERLVYDATGTGTIDPDMYAVLSKLRFYTGTETQYPDPSLEALPEARGGGVGNVPAYVGSAYAVVTFDDLTDSRGRIPQWKFEMASNATVTETCGEEGLLWHFPLSDATPGGIAQEVMHGWNGEYGNDDTLVASGSNLHALGDGSVRFLNATSTQGSCMLAHTPEGETHPFSMADRTAWTVLVWFRLDDVAGGSTWKNIACCWGSPLEGTANWQFMLRDEGDNLTAAFKADWNDIEGIQLDGSAVSVGGSHMLAATYDSATETLTFYQDGIAVGSGSVVPGSFETGGENAIEVGGGAYYWTSYGFNGAVQDLKAYDYALSAAEILNQFMPNPDTMREAPDVPGTYVRRTDSYTVTRCSMSAEISDYMLSEAVTEIARRCGISPAQLDVTADENVPVNYLLGRAGVDGTGAVMPLATLHFRDYVDIGGQIVSVPRGGDEVFDVTYAECLDYDDQELSLRQKIELPKRLNVRYWNRTTNAAQLAFAERESQDVSSQGAPVIEAPLVFDPDIATQKAHILTKCAAEESQGTLKIALPFYKYAFVTVSDCGLVEGKRYRVIRQTIDGGRMELELVRDRVSNYSSNATSSTAIDPSVPVSSLKGPTWFQALNLPRLRTQDNSPGMYVAATGATEGWPGAYLLYSTDGGATFKTAVDVSGQPITFGVRALMGHLVSGIDTDDEPVTIQAWDQRDIVSVTDAQLAARQNAFAITTDGVSEIIQIKNAEESDSVENEFACTTVDRGLLNTAAASHVAEDEVLLLDGAIKFVAIDATFVGQEIVFRAVTRGTPVENNPTLTVTFLPQFTGPATVAFLQTISGDYAETIDGFRIEALSQ